MTDLIFLGSRYNRNTLGFSKSHLIAKEYPPGKQRGSIKSLASEVARAPVLRFGATATSLLFVFVAA